MAHSNSQIGEGGGQNRSEARPRVPTDSLASWECQAVAQDSTYQSLGLIV
eukprot:m.75034 g.75034  ORF g.75034 m.75034 type:complete len:50 (-) comp10374_c0_seq2:126-275(-)